MYSTVFLFKLKLNLIYVTTDEIPFIIFLYYKLLTDYFVLIMISNEVQKDNSFITILLTKT